MNISTDDQDLEGFQRLRLQNVDTAIKMLGEWNDGSPAPLLVGPPPAPLVVVARTAHLLPWAFNGMTYCARCIIDVQLSGDAVDQICHAAI